MRVILQLLEQRNGVGDQYEATTVLCEVLVAKYSREPCLLGFRQSVPQCLTQRLYQRGMVLLVHLFGEGCRQGIRIGYGSVDDR